MPNNYKCPQLSNLPVEAGTGGHHFQKVFQAPAQGGTPRVFTAFSINTSGCWEPNGSLELCADSLTNNRSFSVLCSLPPCRLSRLKQCNMENIFPSMGCSLRYKYCNFNFSQLAGAVILPAWRAQNLVSFIAPSPACTVKLPTHLWLPLWGSLSLHSAHHAYPMDQTWESLGTFPGSPRANLPNTEPPSYLRATPF